MRKILLLSLAPLILTGCQTWGPSWSEVTGTRYHLVTLNRNATIIENIDGTGAFPNRLGAPIRIEPGKRLITLQGVPLRPGWQGTLKDLALDAAPCKRYFINAQFEGPLSPSDWKPVIDEVETIAGCGTVMASK